MVNWLFPLVTLAKKYSHPPLSLSHATDGTETWGTQTNMLLCVDRNIETELQGDGTNDSHMLHMCQYSMQTATVCERKHKSLKQVRLHICMFFKDVLLCLCTCLPWSSLSPEGSARLQCLQQTIHDTSFIPVCKHRMKTSAMHQETLD